jgi:hypothetical protein
MPRVAFTRNLQHHIHAPAQTVAGANVRAVLEAVFADNPDLRGYVLDDQGALRKHVVVYVDDTRVSDRAGLSDAVGVDSEVFVMQALSGG